MTVIQPNSVSGINSITVQNGNSLSVHKSDGSLIRTITGTTGITTFRTISVGSATTDFAQGSGINIGLGASISNGSGNVLTFGTNGDDRVTINATGKLGIGDADPDEALHVYAVGGAIKVDSNGDSAVRWATAGTNKYSLYHNNSANALIFYDNGNNAERLRIHSSGDVGIGTDSASCAIDVIDNSASGYIAEFRQVHASNSAQIVIDSPTDSNLRPSYIDLRQAGTAKWSIGQVYASTSSQAFHICSGSNSESTSKLVITTAGLTGIGTASPDSLLHLGAGSGTAQLKMQRTDAASNTNDYGRIYWESYSGTLTGQISVARESAENDGYMHFKTATGGTLTERLRIASDGKISLAGDTDTHISHPSANYLRVTTGGNIVMDFTDASNVYIPDTRKLMFGNHVDLQIFHDSNGNNKINTSAALTIQKTSGSEPIIDMAIDGAVSLYHDNVKTFNTASTGIEVRGPEGGNCELYMYADEGDDNADLWKFVAFQSPAGNFDLYNKYSGSWEKSIGCAGDAGVSLWFNNTKRFETTDDGIMVTGSSRVYGHHNSTHGGNQGNVFTQGMTTNIAAGGSATFTFTGLNSAWATIRMGGYSSSGQSSFHYGTEMGGYMTGTNMYNNVESANWASGCSISISKNTTSFVVTITNNANDYGLATQIGIESSTSAFICTIS